MRKNLRRGLAALSAGALLTAGSTAMVYADDPQDPESPEIVNVAIDSDEERAPEVSVSYVPDWNSATALNDGKTTDAEGHGDVWGTYGDVQETHWAEYTWPDPVTVSASNVWFWNDEPDPGNVRPPESWSLEYFDDEADEYVAIDAEYPVEGDSGQIRGPNEVTFDEVTTTQLRMLVNAQPMAADPEDEDAEEDSWYAVAATEWEVIGYYHGEGAPEPEPEDPNAPLDWEDVSRRTLAGEAPELPEQMWVISENGPLAYYDVIWDDDGIAWDETVTVTGTIADFDLEVEATVYVVDALDAGIDYLEYSSTITTPGVAPECPATVTAAFEDGSSSSDLPVEWEELDAADYAEAEQFGDILGAVENAPEEAICTYFVVDPEEGDDLPPVVNIEIDDSPAGTGWYLESPSFTLEAEALSGDLETVEYSLDGGSTWTEYTDETEVTEEGEVVITARATDDEGREGDAERTINVDTRAPETTVDYDINAEAGSARFTLETIDPEPGSGLRRVLFSYGTSEDPTNLGENEMWATYEDPFSVSLRDVPVFVHVHSQDYAGHQEETQTFELPSLDEVEAPGDGDDEDGNGDDGSGEDGDDQDGSGDDGSDEDGDDEDGSDEDGSDEDDSEQDGQGGAAADGAGSGGSDDPDAGVPGDDLPRTGATTVPLAIAALVLLALGFGTYRVSRARN